MKRVVVMTILIALAGCGKREELKPVTGASLPPKPAFASATPTPDELLTTTTQQRPQRSDELLKKSDTRRDDRFDQPPRP